MSLQRNLSVPRMMEEKISWAEMATEDYYPEIPLSQWQPCHFTYLSHYYFDYQQSVPRILSRMFQTATQGVYTYTPNDQILGHKVELITSYFDLMTITQDLNVCTAVRQDLVDGFLKGTHLRWKISNEDGITVGVIGVLYQKHSFQRTKLFKGLNFEVYALGRNHRELNDSSTVEDKVFSIFINRHGQKIIDSFQNPDLMAEAS
jgi:hypothetical protein